MGFLPGIGTSEMLIVGVIALLLFGKNLPGVARNLGKSMAELKKGLSGFQEEFRNATREAERSVAYSPPVPASRTPAVDPPSRAPASAPAAVQAGSADDFTAPRFELD
jgi:sec-independent protein translocase protein TatA